MWCCRNERDEGTSPSHAHRDHGDGNDGWSDDRMTGMCRCCRCCPDVQQRCQRALRWTPHHFNQTPTLTTPHSFSLPFPCSSRRSSRRTWTTSGCCILSVMAMLWLLRGVSLWLYGIGRRSVTLRCGGVAEVEVVFSRQMVLVAGSGGGVLGDLDEMTMQCVGWCPDDRGSRGYGTRGSTGLIGGASERERKKGSVEVIQGRIMEWRSLRWIEKGLPVVDQVVWLLREHRFVMHVEPGWVCGQGFAKVEQ